MSFSESLYVLLVLWGLSGFVIWYFFRHAPGRRPGQLVAALSVSTSLFLLIATALWFQNRPDYRPLRIAVFPFVETEADTARLSWPGLALADLTLQCLSALPAERVLVYPLDWIRQAAWRDSLTEAEYVVSLAKRLGLHYAVQGHLQGEGEAYRVRYQVLTLPAGSVVDAREVEVGLYDLPEFAESLATTVAESVGLPETVRPSDLCCLSQIEAYYKAQLAAWKDEPDKAVAFAREAIEDSASATALVFLARLLIEQAQARQASKREAFGMFKEAKTLLSKAASLETRGALVQRVLGELYLANERWNEAERHLLASYRLNPYDPETLFQLTRLHPARYQALGFRNDRELLERALLIHPGYFEARLTLADRYTLKNRPRRAREQIEAVLRVNPVHVDALMALAKVYLLTRDWLPVLETYEKVLEIEPQNADVFFNIGIVYYQQKDYDQAVRYFEHAIRLNDHVDSYLYLAYIFEKQGDLNKAVEYLRARIRKRTGRDDRFAEEARKHLYKIMQQQGKIDSLLSNGARESSRD